MALGSVKTFSLKRNGLATLLFRTLRDKGHTANPFDSSSPPPCVSHLRHTSEPEKLFLRGGKRSSEGHFPEKLWPISRSPSPRRPLGRDWCPKKEKRGRYRMGGSGGGDKKREEKSRRGSEKGPLLARRHICGHLVPF